MVQRRYDTQHHRHVRFTTIFEIGDYKDPNKPPGFHLAVEQSAAVISTNLLSHKQGSYQVTDVTKNTLQIIQVRKHHLYPSNHAGSKVETLL